LLRNILVRWDDGLTASIQSKKSLVVVSICPSPKKLVDCPIYLQRKLLPPEKFSTATVPRLTQRYYPTIVIIVKHYFPIASEPTGRLFLAISVELVDGYWRQRKHQEYQDKKGDGTKGLPRSQSREA